MDKLVCLSPFPVFRSVCRLQVNDSCPACQPGWQTLSWKKWIELQKSLPLLPPSLSCPCSKHESYLTPRAKRAAPLANVHWRSLIYCLCLKGSSDNVGFWRPVWKYAHTQSTAQLWISLWIRRSIFKVPAARFLARHDYGLGTRAEELTGCYFQMWQWFWGWFHQEASLSYFYFSLSCYSLGGHVKSGFQHPQLRLWEPGASMLIPIVCQWPHPANGQLWEGQGRVKRMPSCLKEESVVSLLDFFAQPASFPSSPDWTITHWIDYLMITQHHVLFIKKIKWVNKPWHSQTMEYDSAIKRNELPSHKKSDLTRVLQSERSQCKKVTCSVMPIMEILEKANL